MSHPNSVIITLTTTIKMIEFMRPPPLINSAYNLEATPRQGKLEIFLRKPRKNTDQKLTGVSRETIALNQVEQ